MRQSHGVGGGCGCVIVRKVHRCDESEIEGKSGGRRGRSSRTQRREHADAVGEHAADFERIYQRCCGVVDRHRRMQLDCRLMR